MMISTCVLLLRLMTGNIRLILDSDISLISFVILGAIRSYSGCRVTPSVGIGRVHNVSSEVTRIRCSNGLILFRANTYMPLYSMRTLNASRLL